VDGSGVIFAGGKAFRWNPWEAKSNGDSKFQSSEGRVILDKMGKWAVEREAFGILDLLWPKPDLLILGTGAQTQFLSPMTRKLISEMGIRVEVMDSRNAAAQYNILVTERGIDEVAAALVPMGHR